MPGLARALGALLLFPTLLWAQTPSDTVDLPSYGALRLGGSHTGIARWLPMANFHK